MSLPKISLKVGFILSAGILCAEQPAGYKLTWADEFTGSAVDTAGWGYRIDSKHWSTQKPENVSVANGYLVLCLKKEKAADKEYTGAGVISKQSFRYGYYETRFRIDAGKGWHSSFWMMGHDGSGSTGTAAPELELDCIENDSIDLTSYGVNTHKWQGQHTSHGGKRIATPPLSDFHIYGAEYTPQEVKYYFDGQVVQTVDISKLPQGDVHIWLTSIASYLGKTDAVDETRLPGRVEYDYVRFYTKP
ncbi:MAG: glycoside hydrolase family 16 protein [Candidatus Solibacter sp.]|nr:glycoside hydrolase family 16 protein [Candidatus Solibacter sp.]